jgi:hypothetical protein
VHPIETLNYAWLPRLLLVLGLCSLTSSSAPLSPKFWLQHELQRHMPLEHVALDLQRYQRIRACRVVTSIVTSKSRVLDSTCPHILPSSSPYSMSSNRPLLYQTRQQLAGQNTPTPDYRSRPILYYPPQPFGYILHAIFLFYKMVCYVKESVVISKA